MQASRRCGFSNLVRLWAILLAALGLSACSAVPQRADPALWHVESADGQEGWLFGTIHSAPRPLVWETDTVRDALSSADVIMVEVSNLADESEVAATFAQLARNEGQPPLSQRVAAPDRPALAAVLKKSGYHDGDFAAMDTWAAALTLARGGADPDEARNGVDRAVMARATERPVLELEGARQQLGLFDTLPEREQRDLLGAVVREASKPDGDLSEAWRQGDMVTIEKETRVGLLADPELRQVLFVGRNRRWTTRIAEAIRAGHKPFVAVGAAHMAGEEGLPAMLGREGFTVTRIE